MIKLKFILFLNTKKKIIFYVIHLFYTANIKMSPKYYYYLLDFWYSSEPVYFIYINTYLIWIDRHH